MIENNSASSSKRSILVIPAIRFAGKLIIDCLILIFASLLSFLLRFQGQIPSEFIPQLFFALATELCLLIFWELIFGTYKSLWRFTAFKDFFSLSSVITLEKIFFSALTFFFYYRTYPRSVIIISWAFSLIGMVGVRAIRRFLYESRLKTKIIGERKNLLIVGAGSAGKRLAQEILSNPQLGYQLAGFLDDSPSKIGNYLLGYPILGAISNAKEIVSEKDIEEVIIAIPSTPSIAKKVFDDLSDVPVKVRVLPGLAQLASGRPLYQSLRDIDLFDLLPRPPVKVDMKEIARFLEGKVVLVTGAGGSIGSELCRQLADLPLSKLILLGHGENPLFELEQWLSKQNPPFPYEVIVADIRDETKIKDIFQKHRPNIVFHTAAHKHVPLMEINPDEAVTNNVYGTKVLADAARETGVEKFIYISTDKAVNPVNVMGAAKRVGELLMLHYNGNSSTGFISVRFGNVLGSRGSVLEVWERCIEEGEPIPITHPDMERYFMTIPEAVNLILKAAELGQGGELFVLDMGERLKIGEFARMYTRLRGLILGKDIGIRITGIRKGEKLKEELIGEGEIATPTSHPGILRVISNEDIDEDFFQKLEVLFNSALSRDPDRIKSALKQIVKNYNYK